MSGQPLLLLISALFFIVAPKIVWGADEACFPVVACVEPPPVPNLNMSWIMSGKHYYNIGTKRDMFRTSVDISGKQIPDIAEDELYYEGCFVGEIHGLNYTTSGFGGKTRS